MSSPRKLTKHLAEPFKRPKTDCGESTLNNLKAIKSRLLQDAEATAEYLKQAPEFAIARELIAARVRAGITQTELAKRMSTTQSTIARLESGRMLPSMRTFSRYAEATNSHAILRLVAKT